MIKEQNIDLTHFHILPKLGLLVSGDARCYQNTSLGKEVVSKNRTGSLEMC
jgi:hypothetical protein